ncbi:hypothetical protein J2045_002766 [Peteryoungia aggregata LMG 23059]|uniref:Uncharacterized protein n=1 Tax=Peteryoungia aggregata LMG 23059 TaxID=1368425 RepID=A0ABU0G8R0_9HYPH|nr:hypothetical protein [Peteryoungia aggregata]MDQ0421726.1 hypothetical protein [Peteryoungia aggregata LMG 23059]
MARHSSFWADVQKNPDRFYIIHYSSQSLFDAEANAGAGALSPRITSVVVRHYESGQTVSFATHTVAEYLGVPWDEIEERYDKIERELLTHFYDWARDRREKYWIHWNMRNVTFGFEHLEHRYRVLTKKEPPSIPVEVRINLNDALKDRYGSDYAPDPRMPSLMDLNGPRIQGFLSGKEESEAFKAKDFIRMNASTIAKVGFFSYVISAALKGRLNTSGSGFLHFIDRLLESRKNRGIATISAVIGLPTGLVQIVTWIAKGVN